jgi:hypothetical protein
LGIADDLTRVACGRKENRGKSDSWKTTRSIFMIPFCFLVHICTVAILTNELSIGKKTEIGSKYSTVAYAK